MFCPPSAAIVGAYHYENVGDMALAAAGRQQYFSALGTSSPNPALQTCANIDAWPGRPRTYVCGGAILTETFIQKLRKRFSDNAHLVALIGVEVARQGPDLSAESVAFLEKAPYVSLRNRAQLSATRLSEIADNVRTHPDIVFAFRHNERFVPVPNENSVAGVNIVGGAGYDNVRTEAESMAVRSAQRRFFRTFVENALDDGLKVVHVPFALNDDMAARKMLDGLPVQFVPFSANPERVLRMVSGFSRFAPSRYHALIFGLLSDLPLSPFLYARKNYWLFEDFVGSEVPLGFREAMQGLSDAEIDTFAGRRYQIGPDTTDHLKAAAAAELETAFRSMQQ